MGAHFCTNTNRLCSGRSDRPINSLALRTTVNDTSLFYYLLIFRPLCVKFTNAQKCVSGKNAREGALCANTSQIMRAAVVSNVPTYFAKVKNKYGSFEELINVGGADAHVPRWEFLRTHILPQ